MEPTTLPPDDDAGRYILESQIRECFGRVVYSHKTHEKCADACLNKLSRIKFTQITLSALTTGGLLGVLLGDTKESKIAAGAAAVISTILLALNTYTKNNDPGQVAQKHKEAADRLWSIRESYLSLLADIRAVPLSLDAIRARRDEMQAALEAAYNAAPRTSGTGYAAASSALKDRKELTFSDDEIDRFLPGPLRRNKPRPPTTQN
jgi:hypothetical protein